MSKKISRRSCAVLSCNNSWYTLEQWSKNICEKHNCNLGQGSCDCLPPFRLFPFPTERKDPAGRLQWTSLVNRKNGSRNWIPNSESRICSKHFVDGEPSARFPYPTLELGYSPYAETKSVRPAPRARPYIEQIITPKKSKIGDSINTENNVPHTDVTGLVDHSHAENIDNYYMSVQFDHSHINADHDYVSQCDSCTHKSEEIKKLHKKIKELTEKVNFYKRKYQIETKKKL